MGEWLRPYEVSTLGLRLSFLVGSVLAFFVCNCGTFGYVGRHSWWAAPLNPLFVLLVLANFFSVRACARTGIFVGDVGVMVRLVFRRVVVPWEEIAYAQMVHMFDPVIRPRAPLVLVLVTPTGQSQRLPVRLSARTQFSWGRQSPPYVKLAPGDMTIVVNCINAMAAARGQQAWPPPVGPSFQPPYAPGR